jgi:putative flippase GtrA
MRGEIAVFAVIGVLSTVLHLGGFVVLRQVVESAPLANAIALLLAAVANTAANRRWTFGVRGRAGAARHQVQGLFVFGLTLAMTTWGLDLLEAALPNASTSAETIVVAVTTGVATAVKFLAMKLWVFAPSPLRPTRAGPRQKPSPSFADAGPVGPGPSVTPGPARVGREETASVSGP